MLITVEEASATADALHVAATAIKVESLKANLRRQAQEWSRAVKWLIAAETDETAAAITCAGMLVPGMVMCGNGTRDQVVRLQWSGGVPSILVKMIDGPSDAMGALGRDQWVNVIAASSPVVIALDV